MHLVIESKLFSHRTSPIMCSSSCDSARFEDAWRWPKGTIRIIVIAWFCEIFGK